MRVFAALVRNDLIVYVCAAVILVIPRFAAHSQERVIVGAPGAGDCGAGVRPLGTFYPQPYMTVLGNGMSGGGYSPLGMLGATTLSEYGPLSAGRQVVAPVVTYQRGYGGVVRPVAGITFSYPNMPPAAPVVYPTRANSSRSFGRSGTPPWWDSSLNWIDQN